MLRLTCSHVERVPVTVEMINLINLYQKEILNRCDEITRQYAGEKVRNADLSIKKTLREQLDSIISEYRYIPVENGYTLYAWIETQYQMTVYLNIRVTKESDSYEEGFFLFTNDSSGKHNSTMDSRTERPMFSVQEVLDAWEKASELEKQIASICDKYFDFIRK